MCMILLEGTETSMVRHVINRKRHVQISTMLFEFHLDSADLQPFHPSSCLSKQDEGPG